MTKLVQKLQGHQDPVWQSAWHPTLPQLLTCSTDKSLRIWSLIPTTLEFTQSIVLTDAHERTIRSVDYHPSGKMFSSSSFDATTAIWLPSTTGSAQTFENEMILEGHENEVKCCRWSPSGELLATCSRDKSVWIWQLLEDGDFECLAVLQEHTQDVKGLVWHPNIEILISFSYDNTMRVWKEVDGDWYSSQTLKGHNSTVWSAVFSSDGQYLVSVGDDLSMIVWKFNSNEFELITRLQGIHTDPVYSVDWGLNHILATCGGSEIKFWKFQDDLIQLLQVIENSHGQADVNHVNWCKLKGYENLLASCGDDGTVAIHHTEYKPLVYSC